MAEASDVAGFEVQSNSQDGDSSYDFLGMTLAVGQLHVFRLAEGVELPALRGVVDLSDRTALIRKLREKSPPRASLVFLDERGNKISKLPPECRPTAAPTYTNPLDVRLDKLTSIVEQLAEIVGRKR